MNQALTCGACREVVPYDTREPSPKGAVKFSREGEIVAFTLMEPPEDVCLECFTRHLISHTSEVIYQAVYHEPRPRPEHIAFWKDRRSRRQRRYR